MRVDPGLAFLAGLAGQDTAERVLRRLRIRDDEPRRGRAPTGAGAYPRLSATSPAGELLQHRVPSSALLWLLEQDDPEANTAVFHHHLADNAIKRDILSGVPFGPGAAGRLKVSRALEGYEEPEIPAARGAHGLVGTLRLARTMRQGRGAAMAVSRVRGDWARVAAADREQALPGYARWALSMRIDCPPELREQFGSHPRFTHRLRQAGIVSGPAEYVGQWRPARIVLAVLGRGRTLFPARTEEAAEVLRPLVRSELRGDVEAWAVLAQLLPTYHGPLPELVATSGAVAYSAA